MIINTQIDLKISIHRFQELASILTRLNVIEYSAMSFISSSTVSIFSEDDEQWTGEYEVHVVFFYDDNLHDIMFRPLCDEIRL